MQERHKAMAAQFGNQPERVVEAAREQRKRLQEEPGEKAIGHAVAYSREKNLEREAVAEERELLRDALKRSMGDATVAEVKEEFARRVQAGEFIETSNRAPGRAFTTEEMIHYERDTIHAMRAGQNQHAPNREFRDTPRNRARPLSSERKSACGGRANLVEPRSGDGARRRRRRWENYFFSCDPGSRRARRL